jgi:hypothetical protein
VAGSTRLCNSPLRTWAGALPETALLVGGAILPALGGALGYELFRADTAAQGLTLRPSVGVMPGTALAGLSGTF